MKALADARRLANFIGCSGHLNLADLLLPPSTHCYRHMGATLADAVLQAGLNYRSVVSPRVYRLRTAWPSSSRTAGLLADLYSDGPHNMLDWRDHEKPQRLVALTIFLHTADVQDEAELARWLTTADNRSAIQTLRGIGPKTVDYLSRLVGVSTVAIDRHVVRFVGLAGIKCLQYADVHRVVSWAADLMGADRGCLDQAIWNYMSKGVPGS